MNELDVTINDLIEVGELLSIKCINVEEWWKTNLNIYMYDKHIYSFESKSHVSPNCVDTEYFHNTLTLLDDLNSVTDYKEEYYNLKSEITNLNNQINNLLKYQKIVQSFNTNDKKTINDMLDLYISSLKEINNDKSNKIIKEVKLTQEKFSKI